MLETYALDIGAELAYAREWWNGRNPAFADFDDLGGDCTNFVSQCIYAGGAVMNYARDVGWYYRTLGDRAAAWTGVMYFYRFMVTNRGAGPFSTPVPPREAEPGDVIQLCTPDRCYHTLFVVGRRGGVPTVAAHTFDAYDRPLDDYSFNAARGLRIRFARREKARSG